MSLVAYDNSDDSEESDVSDNEGNGRVYPLQNQLSESTNGKLNGGVVRETDGTRADVTACSSVSTVDSIGKTVDNNADTHTEVRNANTAETSEFQGHISDEEDEYLMGGNNETSALHLPPPKNEQGAGTSSSGNDAQTNKSSVLLGLPAPKVSSDSPADPLGSGEDELEDLVKPKAAELASRQKPPSTKRKVIKIAAPSLDQYDSDEEEPAAKQLKSSKGGSGLFALLPEPKHVSKKEAGRTLLPHTLKKPAPAKAPVPKPTPSPKRTPVSIIPHLPPEDDSEPEDNAQETTSNFFSFGAESSAQNKPLNPSAPIVSQVTSASLVASDPVTGCVEVTAGQTPSEGGSRDYMVNNEPLQFNPKAVSPYVGPQRPSGSEMQGYEQYMEATSQEPEQEYSEEQTSEPDIPVEELLRLQGRRLRGREAINLIDVQGDAGTSSIELMKNLTQETDIQSQSRNKKDQPSTQEKRKHQITYLAHRAKEREFDLKNQWANNRATKKQTQSKYGF